MGGKVFLVCFFGGAVGTFVALQLWQPIWWVGMLVGGLMGYLSYEFKGVASAIQTGTMSLYSGLRTNFRTNPWETVLTAITVPPLIGVVTYFATWFFIYAPWALMLGLDEFNCHARMVGCTFFGNVGTVSVAVLLSIIAGAVIVCAALGTRWLFIQIHSEIWLLCGLDAAIGTGIGYYLGSALIGAVVGGIFGLVNYQIISVWWLHLVPTSSR